MEIISINNPGIIEKAIQVLSDGGLIVYPTETCYGLGANATDPKAVEKLMKYKTRREGKPLSIAVYDKDMAKRYTELNDMAENIYDNYLPGPITVVSRGKNKLVKGVESEYGTLGIRIPDYKLVLDIIKKLDKPITATSANVSYKKKPYSVEDLLKDLPKKQQKLLDLVIDAGTLPKNEASTVVDTTLNTLNILRKGREDFGKNTNAILEAITKLPEETQDFGSTVMLRYIEKIKNKCILLALGGELGAGKTQFTKGIARQLGIKSIIKSPTFNLVLEYPYEHYETKGKLVHIDTWRLTDSKELTALDLEQYFEQGNIIVIEWADKFYEQLKKLSKKNNIFIARVILEYVDEKTRNIVLTL